MGRTIMTKRVEAKFFSEYQGRSNKDHHPGND